MLKQCLKYIHPDLFGKAPEKIRKVNSTNIQDLNEYLNNVKSPIHHSPIEGKALSFYVKLHQREGEQKYEDFKKFTIELLPLKPQQTQDIKMFHYNK